MIYFRDVTYFSKNKHNRSCTPGMGKFKASIIDVAGKKCLEAELSLVR